MGLSVSLNREKWISYDKGETYQVELEKVFSLNITHRLRNMAEHAGLYDVLWRPYKLRKDAPINDYNAEYEFEKQQEIKASEIITTLERGLKRLTDYPNYFKQFIPSEGWGDYYGYLVSFVRSYLDACKKFPDAIIKVER